MNINFEQPRTTGKPLFLGVYNKHNDLMNENKFWSQIRAALTDTSSTCPPPSLPRPGVEHCEAVH